MKNMYDILVIGLGPAGMAVAVMGAEMGLNVCAVEKGNVGGECLNVGCIPSKGILEHAKNSFLSGEKILPFEELKKDVEFIRDNKMAKMFDKVDVIKEKAHFIDKNTIQAGNQKIKAKKIFVAVGTSPMIPPIEGINEIEYLTNNNVFELDEIPQSLVILGGGAIGSEMAQAFSRLGTKVTIIQIDEYLVPVGERAAGMLLEEVFKKQGIEVLNGRKVLKLSNQNGLIQIETDKGEFVKSEKLLIAAGRKIDVSELNLQKAGVKTGKRGEILVNKYLQTNIKNIYAVGDCNGQNMLSHAAMHQGMIGLMNSMLPFKQDFKKFPIPWTVFTEPQISHVGLFEADLIKKGIKYEVVESRYSDYGAAIAEKKTTGYIKVYASKFGKIYGISIVGAGSGEMINEWTLAIQNKINLIQIMMTAHSFPTMGFLTKRIAEIWMMSKMKSPILRKICQFCARVF